MIVTDNVRGPRSKEGSKTPLTEVGERRRLVNSFDPASIPQEVMSMGIVAVLLIGLVVLISSAIGVVCWCMIVKRTGYNWALGLLMLVPIANIVLFLVLAFGTWPIQRELESLKGTQAGLAGAGGFTAAGGPAGGYSTPLPPV